MTFSVSWQRSPLRGVRPHTHFSRMNIAMIFGEPKKALDHLAGQRNRGIFRRFMSTSRSLETAKAYAFGSDPALCHVYVSAMLEKGVSAMPLSLSHGTTTKKDDREVLLASGGTYYIIGMDIEAKGAGLRDYYINLLATNRRI